MWYFIILILLTLSLYLRLKKILDKSFLRAENDSEYFQASYNNEFRESALLKQDILDLEKVADETIAVYEITKQICKSLDKDNVFSSFKEQIDKYVRVYDCRFLCGDADLSLYANHTILPLKLDKELMGYLVADRINEQDKDKFHILAGQLMLGLKRAYLYQRLEAQAITDSLTQVLTRRFCLERLNEEIERSRKFNYHFSLLMVDIDHFKGYNDRYGHLVGDAILREISKTIKENIRQIDLIGRYGGEEFLVILTETDKEQAKLAAERIRQAIEYKHIKVYDEDLKATISLGISTFPDDAQDAQVLIEKADQALYQAKQTGRNRVCEYLDLI